MKSPTIALMLAALMVSGAAVAREHDNRGPGRGPGPGGHAPAYQPRGPQGGGYRGPMGPGPGPAGYRGGYPIQRGYPPPPAYPGAERYAGPGGWGSEYGGPAAGPSRWRRGQFFPPSYRGEVVGDYQRYHLRRPPPGFYWYRSGDDFVLAALSSGLIFEVVGGGY